MNECEGYFTTFSFPLNYWKIEFQWKEQEVLLNIPANRLS